MYVIFEGLKVATFVLIFSLATLVRLNLQDHRLGNFKSRLRHDEC